LSPHNRITASRRESGRPVSPRRPSSTNTSEAPATSHSEMRGNWVRKKGWPNSRCTKKAIGRSNHATETAQKAVVSASASSQTATGGGADGGSFMDHRGGAAPGCRRHASRTGALVPHRRGGNKRCHCEERPACARCASYGALGVRQSATRVGGSA